MPSHGSEPGIYTLILYLPSAERIAVGALGWIHFPEGFYSYTGSARGPGGLRRLDRHAAVMAGKSRIRRWHIDYLLPRCELRQEAIAKTDLDLECCIARGIGERLESVPSFGCSDCRCPSHLHYSESEEEMKQAVLLAHANAYALL